MNFFAILTVFIEFDKNIDKLPGTKSSYLCYLINVYILERLFEYW